MALDYAVFVHVTGHDGGRVLVGWDHNPARGRLPTSLWPPGMIIEDHGLYFLPQSSVGCAYDLRVGLFRPSTGERLKIVQAAPEVIVDEGETRAVIGTIRVP